MSSARRGRRAVTLLLVIVLHVVGCALLVWQKSGPSAPLAGGAKALEVFLIEAPRAALQVPASLPPALATPEAIVLPDPEIHIAATDPPAVTSVVPDARPPEAPPGPVAATPRFVSPADYLRMPAPRYPLQARQAHQQGITVLLVSIDVQGRPARVELSKSSGYALLDRAAITALRDALFRPFTEAGVAKAVQVLVPVEFSLTERVASR